MVRFLLEGSHILRIIIDFEVQLDGEIVLKLVDANGIITESDFEIAVNGEAEYIYLSDILQNGFEILDEDQPCPDTIDDMYYTYDLLD